ncbi:MAG: hypothetical protein HY898_34020 [Deltaproteobacteria bacterium]|nr:hypothetical protein [Deltaproteobacteria bacterium]
MKKRISVSEWGRRVQAWQRSGLTAAQYGARHDIDSRRLSWWKWWLRRKGLIEPDTPVVASPDPFTIMKFVPCCAGHLVCCSRLGGLVK